ncbi:Astacin (Peptidase M12A) family protein [Brugia pahangi]
MLLILITCTEIFRGINCKPQMIMHHSPSSQQLPPILMPANNRPESDDRLLLRMLSPSPPPLPPPPPLLPPPPLPPPLPLPPSPLLLPPHSSLLPLSFLNVDDIPFLMDHFAPTPFDHIPPRAFQQIQMFCYRKKEWRTVQTVSFPTQKNASDFLSIPEIPQVDVLKNVPKSLIAGAPRFAFRELKKENRETLLKTCLYEVKCLQQEEKSTLKREQIADLEINLAKKKGIDNLEDHVELRLMRTQQVKNSLLEFAGIADSVVPADDGTFQDDVLLTVQQSNHLINSINNPEVRKKRQSLFLDDLPNEKWNVTKPIKYVLDSSLEIKDGKLVMKALDEIGLQTCIKFELVEEQPNESHLLFVKIPQSNICGLSYIGRMEDVNPIYLSFACEENFGIIIHETLHALGINHQQLRFDRDDYLIVMWENINPKLYDYFAVSDLKKFTSYGVSYDYYSIMHYGPYVGGVNSNKPTLVPKYQSERFLKVIGQRKALSDKDVELLTAMYCSKGCTDTNVYCGFWALKQLCTDSSWMNKNCRKSCGLC